MILGKWRYMMLPAEKEPSKWQELLNKYEEQVCKPWQRCLAYLYHCVLMHLGEDMGRSGPGHISGSHLHPPTLQDYPWSCDCSSSKYLIPGLKQELVWPRMKNLKQQGGEAEKEAKERRNESCPCAAIADCDPRDRVIPALCWALPWADVGTVFLWFHWSDCDGTSNHVCHEYEQSRAG